MRTQENAGVYHTITRAQAERFNFGLNAALAVLGWHGCYTADRAWGAVCSILIYFSALFFGDEFYTLQCNKPLLSIIYYN